MRTRSKLENWFLRFSRDVLWARWPHGLDDRLRVIEGQCRRMENELIRLRAQLRRLEQQGMCDGK